MTETVSAPWGNDDEPESVMYALSIAGMGTPFTDYQGTLYGNPRYWPDGTSCAEFKDYGLARAVRVLCNNADAIKAALRTPPQNTDGEAVAWMHPTAGWVHVERKEVAMHCHRDEPNPIPLVPASIVDDLRADLTRYIDIATKEANEAESLRAERDALAKALEEERERSRQMHRRAQQAEIYSASVKGSMAEWLKYWKQPRQPRRRPERHLLRWVMEDIARQAANRARSTLQGDAK